MQTGGTYTVSSITDDRGAHQSRVLGQRFVWVWARHSRSERWKRHLAEVAGEVVGGLGVVLERNYAEALRCSGRAPMSFLHVKRAAFLREERRQHADWLHRPEARVAVAVIGVIPV